VRHYRKAFFFDKQLEMRRVPLQLSLFAVLREAGFHAADFAQRVASTT